MSTLNLADIAQQIGGQLVGKGHFENVSFERVSTDTRKLHQGDLFVALSGDNFNGNEFVNNAFEAGAIAAVVDQRINTDVPHLQVEDARLALGLIARINRRKFKRPLIALTGSAGKTTCKEMLASILAESGPVLATSGNFNNEIGVPKTLLQLGQQHRYAVIEMGASKQGDISYLTGFAEPTIAVLTNAMPAHMEGFGSLDNIAKTKGEVFSSLPNSGTAIINLDDQFYKQWCQQAGSANIVSFSKSNSEADFYASNIRRNAKGQTIFILNGPGVGNSVEVKLPLLGEHNVANGLAAAAAAVAAGAIIQQVKAGLEKMQPVDGRLNTIVLAEMTVIDDSYNASPETVKAAIDVLSSFEGRRCLILGSMAELGCSAELNHRQVAEYARDKCIEQLLVVGEYAALMARAFGDNAIAFSEMKELKKQLPSLVDSETVLVKGSRSARMERAVQSLLLTNGGEQ